jgi:UTP--glucose-1-phosphate uridylyltransferase
MQITSAIIPAAGLGTRFLPFTKAVPKEMLPILNKPAIQMIAEEGIASGIKNFCVITSKEKEALAKHFSMQPELAMHLEAAHKLDFLKSIDEVMERATFTYVNQPQPLGLGHAILMGRHTVRDNYFGIFLPDDLIFSDSQPALAQLITVAREHNASVIAVQEILDDTISAYGVVAVKKEIAPGIVEVERLVEKPRAHDAPSRLAIVGRYVLSHKIFDAIEATQKNSRVGEILLTDAIEYMASQGEKVIAYTFKGERFDVGTPPGWLAANIYQAKKNPTYAQILKKIC